LEASRPWTPMARRATSTFAGTRGSFAVLLSVASSMFKDWIRARALEMALFASRQPRFCCVKAAGKHQNDERRGPVTRSTFGCPPGDDILTGLVCSDLLKKIAVCTHMQGDVKRTTGEINDK